ncbi:MAG: LamG-like jellyroll fold domain-containing protein [Flavobacteriaceae bacterium]
MKKILFILIVGLISNLLNAQSYYVDKNTGNDNNDGLTLQTAWETVSKAALTVQAGATVFIRQGTYHERLVPAHSGTANNKITYTNYQNEVVKIVGTAELGTTIDDDGNPRYYILEVVKLRKSYIVIEGLTLYHHEIRTCDSPGYGGCWYQQNIVIQIRYQDAHHNEILNNKIISPYSLVGLDTDVYMKETGISVGANADYNLIEGNEIRNMSKIGIVLGNGAKFTKILNNTIIDIYQDCIHYGSGQSVISGTLIEGNILAGSVRSDGVQFNNPATVNRGIIVRNNIMYNNAENNIDLKGTKDIVIEGNILYSAESDNDGFCDGINEYGTQGGGIGKGAGTPSEDIIIRNNIIYDNGGGIAIGTGKWRVYNNTLINNTRYFGGPNSTFTINRKPSYSNFWVSQERLFNNIIGDSPQSEIAAYNSGNNIKADYNLYFNTYKSVEFANFRDVNDWDLISFNQWKNLTNEDTHSIVASPQFVNVPSRPFGAPSQFDFSLQSNSPAIDAGGFVTTATSAGSGTQINVADARFFFDGFGIVQGDLIQFEGQIQTAIITAVDYSSNTITVNTSLTWSSGLGLSLAYNGSAPDIGAIEYSNTSTDVIAPTTPPNLVSNNTTQTTTDLNWGAATDNEGVVAYNIYQDGVFITSVTTLSYQVTGLFPDTSYNFTVKARDAAGNISSESNIEIVTTLLGGTCDNSNTALVAFYSFDAISGTTLTDESSNSNNGTIQGATAITGKIDNGLDFDGTDDYVDLGNFNVTGSQITIASWIKADDFGISDARIISKATGVQSDDHTWMLSTIDDGGIKARFRLKTDGVTTTIIASEILNPNVWYHITATYDGSNMRLYINGLEKGNASKTGAIFTSSASIRIGDNPVNAKNFDGIIDELKIYNIALSTSEVIELATCTSNENSTASASNDSIKNGITIYPNPLVENELHIQLNNDIKIKHILIYNIMGQRVFDKDELVTENNIRLNVNLSTGTYLIKIITTDEELIVKKLMVE